MIATVRQEVLTLSRRYSRESPWRWQVPCVAARRGDAVRSPMKRLRGRAIAEGTRSVYYRDVRSGLRASVSARQHLVVHTASLLRLSRYFSPSSTDRKDPISKSLESRRKLVRHLQTY